jgi:hypothetical protein
MVSLGDSGAIAETHLPAGLGIAQKPDQLDEDKRILGH